uniref:Metalloendopeptidase n=1 Tax=Acanthochromis polyacanthus TaxID=80966 RepID=A0A3Q1FKJ2_9TELE
PDLTLCPFPLLLLLPLHSRIHHTEKGSPQEDEVGEEEDTIDMTTRILSTNNGSNENLLEGDLLAPRTRNKANGVVTIPYVVSYHFSQYEKNMITTAMKAFESRTCIRFKERPWEYDHNSIENKQGCFSALGRARGKQVLSLNKQGCLYHGIIIHELNHALGFLHKQTRSDHDSYVRINWQYINPQNAYNFYKQTTNNLNTPYDYSSIMHYGKTAFSMNMKETITPSPTPTTLSRSRWDIQRSGKDPGGCTPGYGGFGL